MGSRFALCLVIVIVPACRVGITGSTGDVICVAASVGDAVAELFAPLNTEVVLARGSSGSLRASIENGAPCEVFVSASVVEVSRLQGRGMVEASKALLGNRLVVAVPAGIQSNATVKRLTSRTLDRAKEILTSGGRVAIGNPALVPAGRYAQAWLESEGLLLGLQSRLVFAASARATLAAVESGSVAAGIVYATDAAITERVSVVTIIDEPLQGFGEIGPILYVAALLGDERQPSSREAKTIFSELSTPRAAEVFAAAGFAVLAPEAPARTHLMEDDLIEGGS